MSLKYRTLDLEGDYTFGVKNNFVSDLDAVRQSIQTKLTLLQGEWWEDLGEGVPYFQHILGTIGNTEGKAGIDLLVQDRILEVQEVTALEEFVSFFEDRQYKATCSASTIYGTIEELEVVL